MSKETLICNFMDDESVFFFLRLSYLIEIRFVYTFHIVGNLNYALEMGLTRVTGGSQVSA